MKRVLIVTLVVLELALVALVWWASTHTSTHETAPVAEPELPAQDVASEAALELDAPAREPVQSISPRDAAPREPMNRRRLPPPPPDVDPLADAELHGLVVFADTGLPVSGGIVQCACTVEHDTVIGGNTSPKDRTRQTDTRFAPITRLFPGAEIQADGTFVLQVQSSARIQRVDLSGLSRSEAPAGQSYLPRVLALDKPFAELGSRLRIEVVRGFEITGLVVDAASGAPIAGARVETAENWALPDHADTDASGRFVLAGMGLRDPGKRASLICSHADFLRTELEFQPDVLRPNGPRLVLQPRRGLSISGRLLDQHDQPLWGIAVRLDVDEPAVLESERPEPQPRRERTGLRGEFRFSPLPACANVTLTIEEQTASGRAILEQRFELGALRSDRADVVLRTTTGVTIAVHAELASGSRLRPNEFTLVCPAESRARVLSRAGAAQRVNVPLHELVEIEAFARAGSSEPRDVFVRGTGRVLFDRESDTPQSLTIVLDAPGRFRIPAAPEGSVELALPAPEYLRGALDVQLLDDATGEVLQGGREVRLSCGQSARNVAGLPSGWVRLTGKPGAYPLHVLIPHIADDTLQLTIPSSGHAKRVARVRTSP